MKDDSKAERCATIHRKRQQGERAMTLTCVTTQFSKLLMWKQVYDTTDEHNCTHAIPT